MQLLTSEIYHGQTIEYFWTKPAGGRGISLWCRQTSVYAFKNKHLGFFKISQAGYLALAVNEKSGMLNQYYNILNTQYSGYGNSFFSLFWNIFFSSGLVCGALSTADWCLFFIGAEGSKCTTLISSPIKDSIKLS